MASIFRADEWVRVIGGQAVQGAHVYWLTQPVTVPSFEPVGGPPNQAAVFTDLTGTVSTSQPLVTDGFGHVNAYLGSGFYTLAVYVNGNLMQTFVDQTVGGSGVVLLNGLVGAINIAAGSNVQVQVINQNIQISGISGFPLPSATATGDMLRFNILGDNAWEPFNSFQLFTGVVVTGTSAVMVGTTTGSGGVSTAGTASVIFPTLDSPAAVKYTGAGTSSTNAAVGINGPTNGNNSLLAFGCNQRLTFKLGVALNTNCRYWFGLATESNASGFAPLGATYTTDTPNNNTIGFRYSPGTDTHWQAAMITHGASSGAMTLVDTGVAPVNGTPQIFDIVANAASTSFAYYINGALVATISTNIPPFTNTFASSASFFAMGDNKNTANTPIINYYYGLMSMKGQTSGV